MFPRREVRTLDDFRETGRSIRAFCSHYYVCSHDAQLRLELLAFHLGWTFDFYTGREHLAGRLRCSVCGAHHPTFALGHANKVVGYAGTHSAGFQTLPADALTLLEEQRAMALANELPWVGTRKGGAEIRTMTASRPISDFSTFASELLKADVAVKAVELLI